ncbi:protein ATP1B4-like isoform X1 [Acipenser ruthenus]|uniref:protein ATP1B4-like isoform X1 n=2 Tax=Acipenser ruthenus TaxID=7906 RepID=UPI00145BA3E2|nr:protein ATP1B4-like isoform X1 [Acipenser ruthenus]
MEQNSTAGGATEQYHGNYLSNPAVTAEPRREEEEEEEEEEEDDDEMPAERKNKKSWGQVMKELKLFWWNPETHAFMGRSGKSWGLILLFYTIFYSFLAAMFTVCMYALMMTISPYTPTYRDRVVPPGVMISPRVGGFDIAFNASDPKTWAKYAETLNAFLTPYNDVEQERKNVACTPDVYFKQDDREESAERKACQFKRSSLGNCSGIEDPSFGYSEGKPCILLKMNRIIGYLPGEGTPVTVSCEALKGDVDRFGAAEFHPYDFFNLMYYPYYGKLTHVNYTSPLVAIRFPQVTTENPLTVQCKLNGKGIKSDSMQDRFLGRITFTLQIGA